MTAEIKKDLSESFQEMVLRHNEALYRTARAKLRNDDLAQETVQETYFQAFRCFQRFETGTNAKAWLFSILQNVIRHHRRKYISRWQASETRLFEETLRAPDAILTAISDKRVLASLATIPPSFAQIVILADIQELTYREIADRLRVPIGTVMSRLNRGRRLLRDQLREVAQELGIGMAEAPLYAEGFERNAA